jgi:hypothetical protein
VRIILSIIAALTGRIRHGLMLPVAGSVVNSHVAKAAKAKPWYATGLSDRVWSGYTADRAVNAVPYVAPPRRECGPRSSFPQIAARVG